MADQEQESGPIYAPELSPDELRVVELFDEATKIMDPEKLGELALRLMGPEALAYFGKQLVESVPQDEMTKYLDHHFELGRTAGILSVVELVAEKGAELSRVGPDSMVQPWRDVAAQGLDLAREAKARARELDPDNKGESGG